MNLTQEEISTLRVLKENTEKITKEFGLIRLAQISIEKRENETLKLLDTLKKQEKEVVEVLEKKYGQGSIDIDKGTFTAAK